MSVDNCIQEYSLSYQDRIPRLFKSDADESDFDAPSQVELREAQGVYSNGMLFESFCDDWG